MGIDEQCYHVGRRSGTGSLECQREVNGPTAATSSTAITTTTSSINRVIFCSKGTRIIDPCLSKDFTDDGIYKKRHYSLKGSGRFRTCQNDLVTLLNTTAKCKKKPCSLNGIHQPSVDFRNSEFFGFAEFWYSTQDVLRMGASYEGDKMDQMAVVCTIFL